MIEGLAISDLKAGYRRRAVVQSVSLPHLAPGQVMALIGPNGAGKSTLLRALAGLLPATGSVRLDGLELVGLSLPERSRFVGFMPQAFPDGATLTVFESIVGALRATPLGVTHSGGPDIQARAAATLDRLGAAALASTPLDRLSGGQRQLVGLAQALVRGPRLLLLDEPTSALDLRHQIEVMKLVRDLASEGRIVIMVLHDIALAARWADCIVLLNKGHVHAAGSPCETLTPATFADVYGVDATVTLEHDGGLRIVIQDILGGAMARGAEALC